MDQRQMGHPIFSQYRSVPANLPEGFSLDSFLGTIFRQRFNLDWVPGATAAATPRVDDEYFEWITLLTAVHEAGECFTFFELGAGYGRWSIRAAAAARQQGRKVKLVCVEAEPQHFEWLVQTLRDNGVNPDDQELHCAAVAQSSGKVGFEIGNSSSRWSPGAFWGQAIDRPAGSGVRARFRYVARRVRNKVLYRLPVTTVDAVTLDELMSPMSAIDLIDLDVQGAELDVVAASRDLKTKVKRLFIETHSADVESGLRRYLRQLGWRCEVDYGFRTTHSTAYGEIKFQGGVQSWRNPLFEASTDVTGSIS